MSLLQFLSIAPAQQESSTFQVGQRPHPFLEEKVAWEKTTKNKTLAVFLRFCYCFCLKLGKEKNVTIQKVFHIALLTFFFSRRVFGALPGSLEGLVVLRMVFNIVRCRIAG